MEVTSKEQKRAEQLLTKPAHRTAPNQEFQFHEALPPGPRKSNLAAKDKYGPGILTLHLKEGKEKVIYLPPFRHPSSVIRYLVSQESLRQLRTEGTDSRRGSHRNIPASVTLYVLFFVLFLIFLILGYYSISGNVWWGFIPAIISFCIKSFFHQHADDPLLLPDVGQ